MEAEIKVDHKCCTVRVVSFKILPVAGGEYVADSIYSALTEGEFDSLYFSVSNRLNFIEVNESNSTASVSFITTVDATEEDITADIQKFFDILGNNSLCLLDEETYNNLPDDDE